MTKPTDDLEAVRIVAEALQGFDARDQERIIRWAREKLGHAAATAPAVQPPPVGEPLPPPPAATIPAPPAATSPVRNLRVVERPVVEQPEVEQFEAEPTEAEQFEVEQPAVEEFEAEQRGVQPAGAVNILMPPPEHKNRAFTVIGIILLTVAVVFLIVMIVSHGK